MIGIDLDYLIKERIKELLTQSKEAPEPGDLIETDSFGEVVEKLIILHCRMWYIEDAFGRATSDAEIVDLKKKLDICFKVKRPKFVEALNRMVDKAIRTNKSLVEDSVKVYK